MSTKSSTFAYLILDTLLVTPAVYVSLIAADGHEITTPTGKRTLMDFSQSDIAEVYNGSTVTFSGGFAEVVDAVYASIWDTRTQGTGSMLYCGELTGQPILITPGDTVQFSVGDFTVSETYSGV